MRIALRLQRHTSGRKPAWFCAFLLASALRLTAQQAPQPACSMCAEWNKPQAPVRIYGDTYYVGPHGLSSILIASPQGDILLDAALVESAAQIAAHVRQLGFRVQDIKLILTTHVHSDHAGGVAELARLSGAQVVASRWSAEVLRAGGVGRDDPQFGDVRGVMPVTNVRVPAGDETLHVGPLAVTAHATPGHTPGGTSWTWTACEASRCLHMVYADSISAVAAPGWRFTDHPDVVASFEKSFAFLDTVPCDILLTPHPDASTLEDRVAGKLHGAGDGGDCRRLAQEGRDGLKKRLAKEAGHGP